MTLQFIQAERNLKAIHELAEQHIRHGEYEEAIEVFEEILRGQKEIYGEYHVRVGVALHNLSTALMRARKYSQAVEVCKKAIEVRKVTLSEHHPDLAVSLAQLGIAHLELDEHRLAIKAFRYALSIRIKTLGRVHLKVARLLNNIGCSLFELGQLKEANVIFEEALDVQQKLLRHSSPEKDIGKDSSHTVNQLLLSVAATQCNIGSIKLRWKLYKDAIIYLEEALLIQQSVLGDDHPTAVSTKDSIDLVEGSIEDWRRKKLEEISRKNRAHKGVTFDDLGPILPTQCGFSKVKCGGIVSDVMALNKAIFFEDSEVDANTRNQYNVNHKQQTSGKRNCSNGVKASMNRTNQRLCTPRENRLSGATNIKKKESDGTKNRRYTQRKFGPLTK